MVECELNSTILFCLKMFIYLFIMLIHDVWIDSAKNESRFKFILT